MCSCITVATDSGSPDVQLTKQLPFSASRSYYTTPPMPQQTENLFWTLTLTTPLSKHGKGQKNNDHMGSLCLDMPVLAREMQHKKTLRIENLHMLPLWGRLWSRLVRRLWNRFRLPILGDKTVIKNIFLEFALENMA